MSASTALTTFTERLARRKRVWWGRPPSLAVGWHRLWDRYRLRDRTWSLDCWRCCDVWQRSLLNKWNSREFAAKLGLSTPQLYWSGRRVTSIPFAQLPERFVVRPAWGTRGVGTYVMNGDLDLISGRRLSHRDLRQELLSLHGRLAPFPLLIEALVPNGDGQPAQGFEYRCYMFGGHVGAIRVTRGGIRVGDPSLYNAYYTEQWQRLDDPCRFTNPLSPPLPAPSNLPLLLRAIRTVGAAVGTFMRVDCYLPPGGPVLGELSSTPSGGTGYTPFADALFGQMWEEHLGNRS